MATGTGIFNPLSNLYGRQGVSAFSGGSFATPPMREDSLINRFAPNSDIQAPNLPIRNPFDGRQHSRGEVPSSSREVDLGEMVTFRMMTNFENFLTKYVMPLVNWGWAVRTFSWGVWDFPQYPVRPTPETAPPRFLSSSRLSETTSMLRYSIGQHFSSEFFKTDLGKRNHGYNLQQIEYSTQECLNLMVIRALDGAQMQYRRRLETQGKTTKVDIVEAMVREKNQFCKVQKDERGFQTLYEEIGREVARNGGRISTAILTTRINTLVLARPEMVEFSRRGPEGPAIANDPNRTFFGTLQNAPRIFTTQTFPERFNMATGPWQSTTQIGGYHKSLELPQIRSNSTEYAAKYTSKVREPLIYDQESDSMVSITLADQIENSYIFSTDHPDGKLILPTGLNGKNKFNFTGDFLTFNSNGTIFPLPLSNFFSGEMSEPALETRLKSHQNAARNGQSNKQVCLEVFGQLHPDHFSTEDIAGTGTMLIHRIAKQIQYSWNEVNLIIRSGIDLYRDMCTATPDLDFVHLVLKNQIINAFKSQNPTLRSHIHKVGETRDQLPNPDAYVTWVDEGKQSPDAIYKALIQSALFDDPTSKTKILQGGDGRGEGIPLPCGREEDYPETSGAVYNNLTGFASYKGMNSMREAYKSNDPIVRRRFNMKQLKIASEFLDVLDKFGEISKQVLLDCQLLPNDNDKSHGELLCEQIYNMVGIEVWFNVKKVELFLMDKITHDEYVAEIKGNINNKDQYGGVDLVDLFGKEDDGGDGKLAVVEKKWKKRGEILQEVNQSALTRYLTGDSIRGGNQLVEDLLSKTKSWESTLRDKQTRQAFNVALTAITTNIDFFKKDANYEFTTSADLVEAIDAWTKVNILRNIQVHQKVVPGQGQAQGQAAVPNVHEEVKKSVKTVYWKNDLVQEPGLKVIYEKTKNANGLCVTDPTGLSSFVPLFGPLRLTLHALVIQTMTIALTIYKKKPAQLLNVFFNLNSLMMPYLPKKKLRGKEMGTVLTKGWISDNGTEEITAEELFPKLEEFAQARVAYYTKAGGLEFTGVTGVLGLALIYEYLMKEVLFSGEIDPRLETIRTKMLEQLKEATKKELVYVARIDEILTEDSVTWSIKLPFLEDIVTNRKSVTIATGTKPDSVLPAEILNYLILDENTNVLAQELGLRYNDVGRSKVSSAMIGARVFDSDYLKDYSNDPAYDVDSYDRSYMGDANFVKTTLVLSADQAKILINKSMNAPNDNRARFDIRLSQPYNPRGFVSFEAQPKLSALIDTVNRKLEGNKENASKMTPWYDVPLLLVKNRRNITFFGPPSVKHSGNNNKTGKNMSVAGLRLDSDTKINASFLEHCAELDVATIDNLEKLMSLVWMSCPFTKKSCLALAKHNVRIPFNILLVRPHQNYLMEKMCLCAAGVDELGFVAIAGKDYTYGFTTLTKEGYGHLSFWATAVMMQPQNCRMLRNMMSIGYGPGGGTGWYNPNTYKPESQGSHQRPQKPGSPSLMALAVPYTENVTTDFISVTGKLPHLDHDYGHSSAVMSKRGDDNTPHFSTFERYNNIWGWKGPKDSNILDIMGHNGQYPVYNKICWSGFTLYWDPTYGENGGYRYMTANKGHWGVNEGPGCAEVRMGEPKTLPIFPYLTNYITVN